MLTTSFLHLLLLSLAHDSGQPIRLFLGIFVSFVFYLLEERALLSLMAELEDVRYLELRFQPSRKLWHAENVREEKHRESYFIRVPVPLAPGFI